MMSSMGTRICSSSRRRRKERVRVRVNATGCLRWEGQLLSLQHFRDVEIEKVAIEDGLDTAREDGDQVEKALEIVSVGPVEDVESPVGPEGEKVVRGDRFGLSSLADHEQLGQNGDGLQVNGKGPQYFHDVERMINHQRNQRRGNQEKLYSESVMIAVVGGFEFEQHEIDGPVRGSDEEDLHDGVVNRDEVGQQVQVARRENEREQDLRLARDAGA